MSFDGNKARLQLPPAPAGLTGRVKAWSEGVELLTFLPEPPDRNPMFLESRVYQGSSGRVYPLPFIDRVAEEPVMRLWKAIHIENEYLRLMILPEIGGRIHVGLDKTNGYDFFYRQNVIKPALVGLAGPWISGGVEFNWPQHHRPATFMPVETTIEHDADGSVTVWCSDHDPLQRMKGMHGICLYPGRALVEVKVRLYNRTSLTQTFLWWANVAARVHEKYQSFFPPDVRFVADHAKRAVTTFPRSDRPYYGVDYPRRLREGVPESDQPRLFRPDGSFPPDDLSWYANIPVPTSYMALSSNENFFGGYDHRASAGVLHYADHHIAPGKKQWTWGNHEFGYAWDRSLTEDDGPYIELMAGVYTDNQPDFSFLAPGETKPFSHFWYPLRNIGPPKAASIDVALNVTLRSTLLEIGLQVTRDLPEVTITLLVRHSLSHVWTENLEIASPRILTFELGSETAERDIEVRVEQGGGALLRYAPGDLTEAAVPPVAVEPPPPQDVVTNDQLYLIGLHLAQYRHATRRPEIYWREAVRRDAGDARANTALGRWHLDRGEFEDAEQHLRATIARLTSLNPNPYDGEAFYLLGVVLRLQGRVAESYTSFAKSAWNSAWKAPAHYGMAQIEASRGSWESACRHVERSLAANGEDLNARNLRVVLLRRLLLRNDEADRLLRTTRTLDPLDHWSRYLQKGELPPDNFGLLDLAWDYVDCGESETALYLLRQADVGSTDGSVPIVLYTLAYVLHREDRAAESEQARLAAASTPTDLCFPHGVRAMQVLQTMLTLSPDDARANYYLGDLLYDNRRYEEAIALWEKAAKLEPGLPTVHRNLGIALFNVRGDADGALAAFDRAHHTDLADGRILYERDQLWKRLGIVPATRLEELQRCAELVDERDDLSVELATLLNQAGRPDEALAALLARTFQPWEGGEGLVLGQYTRALVLLAKQAIQQGDGSRAVTCLERALQPPFSLGEARHLLSNGSDIEYWLGAAHACAGDLAQAKVWWTRGARAAGDFQGMIVLAVSEMTYWRGAALQRLGETDAADQVFQSIRAYAATLDQQEPSIDYFATSLPAMLLFKDDLGRRQRVLSAFLRAQAALGLEGAEAARPLLDQVIALDPNHGPAADLLRDVIET